ncbi:unnamed protein product [Larinioides sclopetarius]|uniref:DNA-directed RNA polymerase n=1 Tax=Larinioides sclopetarius TaxID=280406 RepID=A0AAV1ZGI2_9ARAC
MRLWKNVRMFYSKRLRGCSKSPSEAPPTEDFHSTHWTSAAHHHSPSSPDPPTNCLSTPRLRVNRTCPFQDYLGKVHHFRDKVFWFPHNLDFRGRAYPTPPHFNHLGSDLIRSILLFAEGQPLGKYGLDWLKIQLINLTGFKKRESSGGELLTSHGKLLLAHYAALGRDELGAIEVNLHPSDAPQDVYSGVSALVERERQKDAADGLEVSKKLEGFVRRKVVKQTVMTFVYGVTKYGAKLQILKQLKDIPEFDEKYHQEASLYLMQKIFFSIKKMFTATQEIQDWFTDCAEHITRVSGEPLQWVTPLGLPVIQPYHKEITLKNSRFSIQTSGIMQQPQCRDENMEGLSILCSPPLFCSRAPQEDAPSHASGIMQQLQVWAENRGLPNTRKQKNGFVPNFIHSLDASHMMLTSLFCQRQGITFVSVHETATGLMLQLLK